MPFPLSDSFAVPTGYAHVSSTHRNNVFYVGDTVTFTLDATGATAYTVRDYYGATVATGSVSGTTVTPTVPVGGWKPGWYRLYLTGNTNDANYGQALGSANFTVIRSNANFMAMPAANTSGGIAGSETSDFVMKGVLGIGTSRLIISTVLSLNNHFGDSVADRTSDAALSTTYWLNNHPDAARPRLMWCSFPNQTWDVLNIGALRVYCKTGALDGSTISVAATAGTSSGTKLVVSVSGVATETFDNLASADAAVTALAASNYVVGFGSGGLSNQADTAIGNGYFNGTKSATASLYAVGVTRFEGPANELNLDGPEFTHRMRLFQACVHAANAAAKAIGPCIVDLNTATWDKVLAAGMGTYCDEFATHAYNAMTNGDLSQGRAQIALWRATIAKYGFSSKPVWQTEAGQSANSVYGVYHPRRSRVGIIHTLLWEEFGVPRERNTPWYDESHGFWSVPIWLKDTDGSLAPHAAMYRVLAEETYGQTFNTSFTFGPVVDRFLLAHYYRATDTTGTLVTCLTSAMGGPTGTFTVTGASNGTNLTVVDAFGNTSSVTVTAGKITVTLAETPVYVRLPAGVTVAPYQYGTWPVVPGAATPNTAPVATSATVGGVLAYTIADGVWNSGYNAVHSPNAVPDTAVITWPTVTRVDRVLIYGGRAWQSDSTLIDFDVQTSVDGTTWVTQATITKPTPTSFVHGADWIGSGCQRETFWDEQFVFDVSLPAAVHCKALRLNVRQTSYGGEPDAASVVTGGQGDNIQHVVVQEIVTLCDTNSKPHYLRA